MGLNNLGTISMTTNDIVIAVFCIAASALALIGVWRLRENPYLKYLAASFSFFFISTAASVLRLLNPDLMILIESVALLISALSITLVAYRYRKVAKGFDGSTSF